VSTHFNPSCPNWGNGVVCCSDCYNSHGPCVEHGHCRGCHTNPSPEGQTLCTCKSCTTARAPKPAPAPTAYPSAAQQTASAAERVVEHAAIARARGGVTDAVAYSTLARVARGMWWPEDDEDRDLVVMCLKRQLASFNQAYSQAKAATVLVFLTEHSNGSAHREMDGTWTVKHCNGQEDSVGKDGKKKTMLFPVQAGLEREEAIGAAQQLAQVGLEAWKAGKR
jgi:hypothetical protein